MKLTIDKEFQALIPKMQDIEYRQLEENIMAEGCTHPLDVWDGVIVDGHNRYKICTEHDIPFEVNEKAFEGREAAKIWIIKNQFGRRNLLPFQRAELALTLKPLIEARAKENQGERTDLNILPNCAKSEPIHTREELRKMAGVGHSTIDRTEKILDMGTPEQIQRARNGGKGNSLNAIYTEIVQSKETERTCKRCGETLPIDRFYADRFICKTCVEDVKQEQRIKKEIQSEPNQYRNANGFTHNDMVELNRTVRSAAEQVRDESREVERTVDHLVEDLTSVVEDFVKKVRRSLEIDSTLLQEPDNRSAVADVISIAAKEIDKIGRLLG